MQELNVWMKSAAKMLFTTKMVVLSAKLIFVGIY